jgi:CHAT domain-containing protein
MQHDELAALLVDASNARREALLNENSALADVQLAYKLKDICLDGWSTHPAQALNAAAALDSLSRKNNDPEIRALSSWTAGLKALVDGDMARAVIELDDSHDRFLSLNLAHTAAATQVSKLVALAMLGRYNEAIECGLRARDQFLADQDHVAVGKIEHNIGNIYFRRDQYQQAEALQRSALQRFVAANDEIQITKLENSLALTLSQQHKIGDAEALYESALQRAQKVGLITTQAEIESSIGMLALYKGQYDRALDYLERSRRKYVESEMPHLAAMTEQEIADAYLELNLALEAKGIYERVTQEFRRLGMRAEAARALAHEGRAALMLEQMTSAEGCLARAQELYTAEGNDLGVAMVQLSEAHLYYLRGDYNAARAVIAEAEPALVGAGAPRRVMFAQWLDGEVARVQGRSVEATELLRKTLNDSETGMQPDIAARCLTSLGLLASDTEQRGMAEDYFRRAVGIIEELRAPLPAEEFRTAFFSDKLVPYTQLVRLSLENNNNRVVEALEYLERARSRGLVDSVSGSVSLKVTANDEFERKVLGELEELRYQLNYFYNQINQQRSTDEAERLSGEIRSRENRSLELSRQLQHRRKGVADRNTQLDLPKLQTQLGKTRAIIEYTALDDRLLAFVITNDRVEVVKDLGSETELTAKIAQFRFQVDTLRYGSRSLRDRLPLLTERVCKHLMSLYATLLEPLESIIESRELVVVPHRSMHYLPFQALYDGKRYVIESRRVSYSPSAAVLQQCLAKPTVEVSSSLLMGVADEQAPLIREEIRTLREVLPDALVFEDSDATIDALWTHAGDAELLHLACHAHFRADNPLFSALRLGDGWLTVRDAYRLKLESQLVTLSACETGMNALAPGDELIGLARGFFSAGTPAVLLSLWTVDDEATTQLMTEFYRQLVSTGSLAGSLRVAQRKLLAEKPHPFFWSPFVLVGRW